MKQSEIRTRIRRLGRLGGSAIVALAFGFATLPAAAQQPAPWQLNLQTAHSSVMAQLTSFHNMLIYIIFAISIFVLGLLLYTVVRFNEKRNPTPSKRTHNTLVEVLWTVIPICILVVIGLFSLPLLYRADESVNAEMTIKAIGHQWYWSYEYPDHGDFAFDSFMVEEGDLQPGQPRLLAADENLVLPVGTKIRVLVTSTDVLHAFAVPAFGSKIDAVPGRTNEIWFDIDEPGMYYGQCSELCGSRHGFMPIAVKAVTPAEFEAWVAEAQKKYAKADEELKPQPVRIVRNDAPSAATVR